MPPTRPRGVLQLLYRRLRDHDALGLRLLRRLASRVDHLLAQPVSPTPTTAHSGGVLLGRRLLLPRLRAVLLRHVASGVDIVQPESLPRASERSLLQSRHRCMLHQNRVAMSPTPLRVASRLAELLTESLPARATARGLLRLDSRCMHDYLGGVLRRTLNVASGLVELRTESMSRAAAIPGCVLWRERELHRDLGVGVPVAERLAPGVDDVRAKLLPAAGSHGEDELGQDQGDLQIACRQAT